MNLVLSSPVWLTVPLVLLILAAAIEDAVRLKISNVICGLVLIGGMVAMGLHGLQLSYWQNVVVCVAILAIGTPAFAAGWMGGGDVKLLAALGLWLDLSGALSLITAVFIAGGLLAIVAIGARRAGIWRREVSSKDSRIPYGVAIAAGALFIFGLQFAQRPTNPVVDRIRQLEAQQR